jgi:hypothetical protein
MHDDEEVAMQRDKEKNAVSFEPLLHEICLRLTRSRAREDVKDLSGRLSVENQEDNHRGHSGRRGEEGEEEFLARNGERRVISSAG